jgi:hypothetical protein
MPSDDIRVLDRMDSPDGPLELIAYEEGGVTWVGVRGAAGRLIGAAGLRTGSTETEVSGTGSIREGWAIIWGAVTRRIERVEVRNDDGEMFPACILEIPEEIERDYRAMWAIVDRCSTPYGIIGFDARDLPYDGSDPRHDPDAEPSEHDRLEAIRRHVHHSMRYCATAFLRVDDEVSRKRLDGELHSLANVAALLEGDGTDVRTMLARRRKILDRYLEEVRDDPWTPDERKSQL